jgi:Protein of unknown function (DUF3830)
MHGFFIQTSDGKTIRFKYYLNAAPATVEAFDNSLPFTKQLIHAGVSGKEIWTKEAPQLDILQENASVFTEPGEVVIAPIKPTRAKTAGCMGIYYGPGKGLDSCNIFAKVYAEDAALLKNLGDEIWNKGGRTLKFDKLTE